MDNIIEQILSEIPISKLVKEKVVPKNNLSALSIILIILTAPLWAPVIMSGISAILSLYLAIWGIVLAFYLVVILFVGMGVSLVLASIAHIATGNLTGGMFYIGLSLVLIGLSVILFLGSNWVTKGIILLSKKIWLKLKSFFVKGRY